MKNVMLVALAVALLPGLFGSGPTAAGEPSTEQVVFYVH